MSESQVPPRMNQMLDEILQFVDGSSGLRSLSANTGTVAVVQKVDSKTFKFDSTHLSEVLRRTDADGKSFLQINFSNGSKVLFTDTLVGFKPRETVGLDMSKIPRVVTTPDLVSVYEAIEESLSAENPPEHEVEILKKVFVSILHGAESVGFDLNEEKGWIGRLTAAPNRASA